ncbi:MAG: energy transducer TonB [Pseudomonadota bacterium]
MRPELKLIADTEMPVFSLAAESWGYHLPVRDNSVHKLVPNRLLAVKADKQRSSYLMLALVILAHIAGMLWLVNAKPTLPIVKEVLPPMMVSLVNSPAPQPELVPPIPAPPVVKQQKTIVKQKLTTPKPVATEPVVEQVAVASEAPPSPATPVVATNVPEVSEAPPAKHEVEPVVEPPRFGAAYLNNPAPDYPALSRRKGEQGRVLLRVLVSTKGDAENVQLENSSGSNRLDQAAIDAVKKWRFIPAKRNNQAISAYVLVPVKFSLEN